MKRYFTFCTSSASRRGYSFSKPLSCISFSIASASASCNLTLADRIVGALQLDSLLPDLFAATASCAESRVLLLGVPYEFWSLMMFVIVEALAVWAVMRGVGRS